MANFDYDDFGTGRGNGYNHNAGMSVNALNAYFDGRKPLSKFSAKDFKNAGWEETKKLAADLAAIGFWESYEWHHSGGGWYNEVNFFDPILLVEKWRKLTDSERQKLRDRFKKSSPKQQKKVRVKGQYSIFGGSRKRPKHLGYESFHGNLIGNWIYLDTGGKKKASGNHITWEKLNP